MTSKISSNAIIFTMLLSNKKDGAGNNNYDAWVKESIIKQCGPKYGPIVSIAKTNVAYAIPALTDADWRVPVPDGMELTAANERELYLHAAKNHKTLERELVATKKLFFSDLWNSLSEESQIAAGAHRLFSDRIVLGVNVVGAGTNDNADVLWEILRLTHFSDEIEGDDARSELSKQKKVKAWNDFSQAKTDIATYKIAFHSGVRKMQVLGVNVGTDRQLALKFLTGLDTARYGEMMVHLENSAVNLNGAWPINVDAAYDLARNWKMKVPKRDSNGDMSYLFMLCDEVPPRLPRANADKKKPAVVQPVAKKVAKRPPAVSQPAKSANKPAKESAKETTKPAWVERRQCNLCQEIGHIARNCPNPDSILGVFEDAIGEDEAGDSEFLSDGGEGYCTDCDDLVAMVSEDTWPAEEVMLVAPLPFAETEVLLDSAAGKSVFRNTELLENVVAVDVPRTLRGVEQGSTGLVITATGTFKQFGEVSVAPRSVANILSHGELVDKKLKILYDSKADEFHVIDRNGTLWQFKRKLKPDGAKSRYYVFDTVRAANGCDESAILVETVADNMRNYTVREVAQAKQAVDLASRLLGHASQGAVLNILNGGVLNCRVTPTDVKNARLIFGKSVAELKGKTKRRTSTAATSVVAPRMVQQQQVVMVDIFFVDGITFLGGVFVPLQLAVCHPLASRNVAQVGFGLKKFQAIGASRDFDVIELRCDGEGGVSAFIVDLQLMGIVVNIAGPGEHVPVIERMIQTVKSRVRAHIHALPYTMNAALLTYCVLFCVRSVNLQPSATSTTLLSPQELYSGMRLDMARDLKCGFGDYVHATVPVTDNSTAQRTDGCITLLPTGNATGSVRMYCLATNKVITRDQFTVVPMPQHVIALLNGRAALQGRVRGGAAAPLDDDMPELIADDDSDDEDDDTAGHAAAPLPDMLPVHGRVDVPPAVEAAPADAGAFDEAAGVDQTDIDVLAPPRRFSNRIASRTAQDIVMFCSVDSNRAALTHELLSRSHWYDPDFAFHISVARAMREHPREAGPVIKKELQQMLDKGVWHAVNTSQLSQAQRKSIIRSSMFLKEKFTADGQFDKLKARLVAGGDQQDKGLYDNLSSPTAATSSVMAVVALAAHERRHAVVIDIGGAFLNADMAPTGVEVLMRLDRVMAGMLCLLHPSYKSSLEKNGTMVVMLDKALYGCVEAAALWYEDLRSKLIADGFEENPYDMCVFNKTVDGVQITIVVHVDDLLVTSVEIILIDTFGRYLRSVYPETKTNTGKVLNYIGMTFDFTVPGEVRVTMEHCISDILAGSGVTAAKPTPAADTLFDIRDNAPLAEEKDRGWFHTHVAKVLYLAKRVRPECLVAVAFLSTRVQTCNIDDLAKLRRLLGYLLGTRDRGIVLRIGSELVVKAFIDAAYGVHTGSGRSHTGCVIVLGDGGPVYAKSTKQKIVTKSSTEAELVALSDFASQAIHMRNFLLGQGYKLGPAIVYQDNKSCMALIKRGGPGSERSRHIPIRYFWVHERVELGELKVEHLGTAKMHVNCLSKAVQGKQFAAERAGVTNWE